MDTTLPTVTYVTTVLSNQAVIAEGHVRLYSLRALSSNVAERYVQLFAGVATRADGSIPEMVLLVSGNGEKEWHCRFTPRVFTPGLVWAWSSTKDTQTLAAPECWLEAQYVIIPFL